MLRDFRKAQRVLGREGARGVYKGILRRIENVRRNRLYREWVAKYDDPLADSEMTGVANAINDFRLKPRISVVMPVYNIEEKWLRKAISRYYISHILTGSFVSQMITRHLLTFAEYWMNMPHGTIE